jgi:hypothetical protein
VKLNSLGRSRGVRADRIAAWIGNGRQSAQIPSATQVTVFLQIRRILPRL